MENQNSTRLSADLHMYTPAHVPHPLLHHAVTTHLHCPKQGGLERGPGARRGHNVESKLEKEQEQIDGPGSTWDRVMWTTRRCYPASSCVSLHNIIFHNTPQCAALWLLSYNDTFTRCEPVQGRDGFDNLRKQTLEGEGRRQQEKRRSNASGSTSCSSPEPGQRNPLKKGHLPTCPPH